MEEQKKIQVESIRTDSERFEKERKEAEKRREIRNRKRRRKIIAKRIKTAKCFLLVLVIFALFLVGIRAIRIQQQKDRFNEIEQELTTIQQEVMEQGNQLELKWKELEKWQEVYQMEQVKLNELVDGIENPEHYINYHYEDGQLDIYYIENGRIALEGLNDIENSIALWKEKDYKVSLVLYDKEIAGFLKEITTNKVYESNQVKASLLLHEIEVVKGLETVQKELLLQIREKRNDLQNKMEDLKTQIANSMVMAQKLQEKEKEIASLMQALLASQEELKDLPERANSYKNCNVVELLARLGNGEGSICSDEEMQVILQVALNRVKSVKYKDSLIGVIFEKSQYSCTYDGNFARPFTKKSINNAIAVLEGALLREVPEDIIYQSREPLGETWWEAPYHYFCR